MHPALFKQEKLHDAFSKLVKNNAAASNEKPQQKSGGLLLQLLGKKTEANGSPRRNSLPPSTQPAAQQQQQQQQQQNPSPAPPLTEEQRRRIEQNRQEALRRREEHQRAAAAQAQQGAGYASPPAAGTQFRASPPAAHPASGGGDSGFRPASTQPQRGGGWHSGGMSTFSAAAKPAVHTFGARAEPKAAPRPPGASGGAAGFVDAPPIVHVAADEQGVLTISGETYAIKDTIKVAAARAGFKASFAKTADGGVWTVDARAEAAVMAALAATSARVVRADLKAAEGDLLVQAEKVKMALGLDGIDLPVALRQPPPAAAAAAAGAGAGAAAAAGPAPAAQAPAAAAAAAAAGQQQQQARGPAAQHPMFAPRDLFAARAGAGPTQQPAAQAQPQPAAQAQGQGRKQDKKQAGGPAARGAANPRPQPPAALRPLAPAPQRPAGWFGTLTPKLQTQFLENQVIRILDSHSRRGGMTSLTPRMIREEISATIGGDDLSAKKPQLRELVAMHTERFLAQEEAIAAQGAAPAARAAQGARAAPVVGPAGAAAAGREQVRALFVNRNGGAAAGGGRAQAVVDEIDLTQQLVDEPLPKKRRRGAKEQDPAAAAAKAPVEVVDLCDSDDGRAPPSGAGAGPGAAVRSELVAMGFPAESAKDAVAAVGANLTSAVGWIVQQEEAKGRAAQAAMEETQREEAEILQAPVVDHAEVARVQQEQAASAARWQAVQERLEHVRSLSAKVGNIRQHQMAVAKQAEAYVAPQQQRKGGNGGARNRYGERLAGEAVFAGEFVNMGDWHGGRGRTAGGWEGLGTTTFGFDDFNVL